MRKTRYFVGKYKVGSIDGKHQERKRKYFNIETLIYRAQTNKGLKQKNVEGRQLEEKKLLLVLDTQPSQIGK